MQVYRFRSMKYLLEDKYQELEKQEIYCASPEQLNDPMEGLRDIFWRGDKIVWENFFKHYVFCLYATYFQLRLGGLSMQLNANNIPVLERWDELISPAQRLFNEVWGRFLDLPKIPEFIEVLANTNRKIRYRELKLYLAFIHRALVNIIEEVLVANEGLSESATFHPPDRFPTFVEMLEIALKIITQVEENQDEDSVNGIVRQIEGVNLGGLIELQLAIVIPGGIVGRNCQLVFFDFPRIYLKEIEKLLWSNWRAACFMENYHNSVAWSTYGDKHKGACLIFESTQIDGSHQLNLDQGAIRDSEAMKFRKVVYRTKLNEVDFFRSIGRATVEQARQLWYTDAEGNFSECGDHIPRDGEAGNDDTVPWQESYWDNFYRNVTSKTKDWEYEREWRLVLRDESNGLDEGEYHTLTYDFNSLKGIIFGSQASDEDISRTVKIIQKKCEMYERDDFKFYQADYSQKTGDIRKYEILLPRALQNVR